MREGGSPAGELLNGLGRVRPVFARMGCTVSFICCEEDFLQMPAHQHEVEEKKKESLKKVRSAWRKKRAGVKNTADKAGRACLHVCVCFITQLTIFM